MAAAPAIVHPSESTHYYDRLGQPAYEQQAKAGHMRPTTLADARKLDLVPSVTTILKMAAAPGLENWKQQQVLMSALTLPRDPGESEEGWMNAVMRDSQEQGRKAAERGTEIHAAIERYYAGTYHLVPDVDDALWAACRAVNDAIRGHFGHYEWIPERSFAHSWGYGGKADLLCEYGGQGIVLDVKSKDVVDDSTKGYEENLMQLAAYRFGLGYPEARCANIFVTRQEPWTVKVYEWTPEDLGRGIIMFGALLRFWAAKNKYESGWTELEDVEF